MRGAQQRPAQVDVQHAVDLRDVELLVVALARDAGVVDEDVDAPELRLGRSTSDRTCSSSVTSVCTYIDRRPARAIASVTGFATSGPSTSAITTSAPSAANAAAMPPPMPRAPPVTTATLSTSLCDLSAVPDTEHLL